ncbi:hypothetical protein A1355_19915 [Methylomonas koyamae]|uniref:PRTRC system protein F n=2 Tax=Methylococcaceae TaxID=403 RepID=A0A177P4H0_9GAMM|nr:hypothetical protein A1355_19915 [Methylomonas koyamae]
MQHRGSVANLILLARTMNLVTDTAIDQAVGAGWIGLYDCYSQTASTLADHLNQCAAKVANQDAHDDFSGLNLALEHKAHSAKLVVVLEPRFSQFDLLALPPELGRVIAGCLDYILAVSGLGISTDELCRSGYCYWLYEELEALQSVDETVLAQEPHLLAQHLLDNDTSPFCDTYEDADDLADQLQYLLELKANNVEKRFLTMPTIAEVTDTMTEWQREQNALLHSPWLTFIEQTLLFRDYVAGCDIDTATALFESDETFGDESACSLRFGHLIGYGFDWENRLVDDFYEDLMNTGEQPKAVIRMTPVALSGIGETLTMLAKARGLIFLAECLNEP